jgi:hypothetical protein
MNNEWITDRLPTEEDTCKTYKSHVFGRVFVTRYNSTTTCLWSNVDIGEAWQPITVPEPYVKPKRYELRCYGDFGLVGACGYWCVYDIVGKTTVSNFMPLEAAERILAAFGEVMP